MAPPSSRPPGPPTMPSMPPMHQPGFPPPVSSGAPPMGGMTQPSMGRPNATQMQPMPSTYPGSQVSMSGPSFGGPASAGLTGLSGPTLGQAAPPSGTSGAGMSHSVLPGGRRMYPGHAPPSPVENQPSAGSMGMPSHTVSLGSALACFKQIHVVFLGAWSNSTVVQVVKSCVVYLTRCPFLTCGH